MRLLIINGPNINMLGIRERDIYGSKTYADLVEYISGVCEEREIKVEFFQSNHEGAIVDRIQDALGQSDGIVINPAAYTHTSVAIADALKAVAIPSVEVHISDVNSREEFRRISYVRDICIATFAGHGFEGYKLAVERLCDELVLS